ncbi:hypothetical protein STCU_05798 [Strigomonas culicis]|uniref:Uncharacterized protein n=1 Tax=Strigomonas culicis TaxID=28005 RepID=S9UF39_9TRYP|nr:hypothetical protein STCU_05798 [Strigomonas culicis]|eukprot:EPY27344.1 hypothetical protein STCU_05798 [Strigomonas culicis]
MVHCWTHISRHHPISLHFSLRLGHGKRSTNLFLSYRWVGISFLVSVLSVLLVLLDTPTTALAEAFFPSPAHFVLSLLFPFVLLALDWPIKRWRERRFNNMQKFRKLSFGTRLGMHSPRGDYEPEGAPYASGGGAGDGGDSGEPRKRGVGKHFDEALYRYTTMRGGKLELNCVCCDHIGGNYASYHVNANV